MKIIPLSEGTFTVDKTKQFIPFSKEKDQLQHRAQGSLLVEIQPFCVQTTNDIIIIDTGLGYTEADGTLQIHRNLLEHDINPLDVTKVLLSHLHKDHAGGIGKPDPVLKKKFFSFPNATYYVNKQELQYARQHAGTSYQAEDWDILIDSDKVQLTDEKGCIDDYIYYETTGAHSPFHQVFRIEENGKISFFGGDVAPQLVQMKNRFIAKYDFDGKKSMELRQNWWETGKKEKWTFLFYHDIKTPVFVF